MAVLEEIVSKLGFEVEGLAKVKAAAKAFAGVKNEVIASANPLKAVGASAGGTAVAVGKLGAESRKTSRGVLLLSSSLNTLKRAGSVALGALRAVLAVALRLVGVFAGAVAGGGLLAGVFAAIGAKAALARRELAITAKTMGTTAANAETVTNIFKGLGLGDEAEKSAQSAIEKMDELTKSIKKGGEEGDEARKKLKGFGIDASLAIGKDGSMRDSSALLLDVVEAYKTAQEKAQALRKQQETSANPKKKRQLGAKALDQERKADGLAESAGIEGKLKVLIDEKSMPELRAMYERMASLMPTTSPDSERQQSEVAKQAAEAGLKFDAVLKGVADRFTEIGVVVATHLLPPLNSFLDGVIGFAKKIGLISETVGERNTRTEQERETNRATALSSPRNSEEAEKAATISDDRFQQRAKEIADARKAKRSGLTEPPAAPGWLDGLKAIFSAVPDIKAQVSPEMSANKMKNAAAQTKVDNTLTATATATATFNGIFDETAARKVQQMIDQAIQQAAGKLKAQGAGVLGAVSSKGSNTATASSASP